MITFDLDRFKWNKAENTLEISSADFSSEEWRMAIARDDSRFAIRSRTTGTVIEYAERTLVPKQENRWDKIIFEPVAKVLNIHLHRGVARFRRNVFDQEVEIYPKVIITPNWAQLIAHEIQAAHEAEKLLKQPL